MNENFETSEKSLTAKLPSMRADEGEGNVFTY